MGSVLVLERSEALRQQLLLGLRAHGIEAQGVDGLAAAQAVLAGGATGRVEGGAALEPVDVIVLGPTSGSILEFRSSIDVIALVDIEGEPAAAAAALGLRALREGAAEFAVVDRDAAGVAMAVQKVRARCAFAVERGELRRGQVGDVVPPRSSFVASASSTPGSPSAPPRQPQPGPPVLIGDSPQIAAVLTLIRRLAGVRTAVLIGGESGTGKELVAQALHDQSPWRAGPFVAVNCGAIPAGLVESELFGHLRGAFTDAVRDKQGLFQAAHAGTLFLDEIADLPLALQPKLLRVLQDGSFRRVGDSVDVRVDVRVVAATARNLAVEVEGRRFREDLYYRLAGLTIHLPALRDRREDIPPLAMHFLRRVRARLGVSVQQIDPEALRVLVEYSWPGNVRELENTIERAAVLCAGERIDVTSLPERMASQVGALSSEPSGNRAGVAPGPEEGAPGAKADGSLSIKQAARRSEEDLIRRALAVTGGNRTRAAELLEISHRALLYKIKEYGIVVAATKQPTGSQLPPARGV